MSYLGYCNCGLPGCPYAWIGEEESERQAITFRADVGKLADI